MTATDVLVRCYEGEQEKIPKPGPLVQGARTRSCLRLAAGEGQWHNRTGHKFPSREDTTKVLIADDEADAVLLLSTMVRKGGHRVLVARDAMQAYMLAQQQQPDVILLDVKMPAGTGMGALERLKANARTTEIPVLVVSGIADEKVRQELIAAGATAFLEKPVQEADLARWLEQVTQKS